MISSDEKYKENNNIVALAAGSKLNIVIKRVTKLSGTDILYLVSMHFCGHLHEQFWPSLRRHWVPCA